jgi:UDP-N-acetylglucosamine acyltransferase
MMISPHAIVDPKAKLAPDVQVGPWTYIGPDVEIGPGCIIGSHVVIKGPTKIGARNRFFQFASIGEDCQDLKYKGEKTYLEIGDDNTFREYMCVHRGTSQDQGITKIGHHNHLMTYSHVAHDCVLGNHIILGHHAGLAGHIVIDDHAILSAFVGVHQFARIGAHSFLGASTMLSKDLPPFMFAAQIDGRPHVLSINSEGLKRRGFSDEEILDIRRGYKILYRQDLTIEQAIPELEKLALNTPQVQLMIDFVKSSSRGIQR